VAALEPWKPVLLVHWLLLNVTGSEQAVQRESEQLRNVPPSLLALQFTTYDKAGAIMLHRASAIHSNNQHFLSSVCN
jgi:hypothetical protein